MNESPSPVERSFSRWRPAGGRKSLSKPKDFEVRWDLVVGQSGCCLQAADFQCEQIAWRLRGTVRKRERRISIPTDDGSNFIGVVLRLDRARGNKSLIFNNPRTFRNHRITSVLVTESVILDHNIISFLLSCLGKQSCELKEIKREFKSRNFSKEERLFNRHTYISKTFSLFLRRLFSLKILFSRKEENILLSFFFLNGCFVIETAHVCVVILRFFDIVLSHTRTNCFGSYLKNLINMRYDTLHNTFRSRSD